MDSRAALEAVMECPRCSHQQLPAEDSSHVMAWYECARCGHLWSARLRAGRPVPSVEIPLEGEMPPAAYLLMHPHARLSTADRDRLVQGLAKTLGGAPQQETHERER